MQSVRYVPTLTENCGLYCLPCFLRNVSTRLPNCTVLHPTSYCRENLKYHILFSNFWPFHYCQFHFTHSSLTTTFCCFPMRILHSCCPYVQNLRTSTHFITRVILFPTVFHTTLLNFRRGKHKAEK